MAVKIWSGACISTSDAIADKVLVANNVQFFYRRLVAEISVRFLFSTWNTDQQWLIIHPDFISIYVWNQGQGPNEEGGWKRAVHLKQGQGQGQAMGPGGECVSERERVCACLREREIHMESLFVYMWASKWDDALLCELLYVLYDLEDLGIWFKLHILQCYFRQSNIPSCYDVTYGRYEHEHEYEYE